MTEKNKKLRGLCLNYHHTNPEAVGSRRFRNLVQLLNSAEIELDVLAGKTSNTIVEPGVKTAGSFAPFSFALSSIARLKSKLKGGPPPQSANIGLHTASAEVLGSAEASQDPGLRSLLLSFENLPDPDAGWVIPAVLKGIAIGREYDFIISTAPP